MTVIKINAIDVPLEAGDTLAERFAPRVRSMEGIPGSEGFELFRPEDGRTTWLVVTRWSDEESFDAWRNSQAFREGHTRANGVKPVGTKSEIWNYSVAVRSDQ